MVQLTIFQHWFRWWLGAGQATRHYLNHWWLVTDEYIFASHGPIELNPPHPHPTTTHPTPPSAAYMRGWIGWAMVQIMACRLFGAKPLSKQMPGLLSIGHLGTNFGEILIKIQNLKISSAIWRPFCPGGDEVSRCSCQQHISTLNQQQLFIHHSLSQPKCVPNWTPGSQVVAFYLVHFVIHDDVIKWKHFPRYLPFLRGIRRSPVNSHHKGQYYTELLCILWSSPEQTVE